MLDLYLVLHTKLDGPAKLYHPVFDDVDEHGSEGTVAQPTAAGTDEVGVDNALPFLMVWTDKRAPH